MRVPGCGFAHGPDCRSGPGPPAPPAAAGRSYRRWYARRRKPDRPVERLRGRVRGVRVDLHDAGAALGVAIKAPAQERPSDAPALVIGMRADRLELADPRVRVPPRHRERGEAAVRRFDDEVVLEPVVGETEQPLVLRNVQPRRRERRAVDLDASRHLAWSGQRADPVPSGQCRRGKGCATIVGWTPQELRQPPVGRHEPESGERRDGRRIVRGAPGVDRSGRRLVDDVLEDRAEDPGVTGGLARPDVPLDLVAVVPRPGDDLTVVGPQSEVSPERLRRRGGVPPLDGGGRRRDQRRIRLPGTRHQLAGAEEVVAGPAGPVGQHHARIRFAVAPWMGGRRSIADTMPTIDANGLTIGYDLAGAGPPLILLHGATSDPARDFREQLPTLTRGLSLLHAGRARSWTDALGHGRRRLLGGLARGRPAWRSPTPLVSTPSTCWGSRSVR